MNRCIPKPLPENNGSSKTRLSDLISWKILRKNPSGGMIWGIFGAAIVMNGYFVWHFLNHKEYQIDHKKRMWNERVEMLENPVKMKLYYPSEESLPKPCQPLVDIYKKMKEAEDLRRREIEECIKKTMSKSCQ